jgi:hypothetical protein
VVWSREATRDQPAQSTTITPMISPGRPNTAARTIIAPPATAEWIETFHQWLMATTLINPTSIATTRAVTACGACPTSSSTMPSTTEQAAKVRGTARRSRWWTWWSSHRPSRTPSFRKASGSAPTKTAASSHHQSAPGCSVISVCTATAIKRAGASTVGLVASVMVAAARVVRTVSELGVDQRRPPPVGVRLPLTALRHHVRVVPRGGICSREGLTGPRPVDTECDPSQDEPVQCVARDSSAHHASRPVPEPRA